MAAFLVRSICVYVVAVVRFEEVLDLGDPFWFISGRLQPLHAWGYVAADYGGFVRRPAYK